MSTAPDAVSNLSPIIVEAPNRSMPLNGVNRRLHATPARRNRTVGRAALAVAAVLLAGGLGCVEASAADVTRTGTVEATMTVSFVTAPAAGSTISCNLSLIGSDTHAPSENAFSSATVSGSEAVCSITAHYRWHLASASSTMTIAYSVTGPTQASAGVYSVITVPASGTTTKASIIVSQ